jgi:hypothetical protein
MAEKMPVAVEPDAQVLTALVVLLCDFRSMPAVMPGMTRDEIEGYIRGFLLQYPAIAKAETAQALLDRCDVRLPDCALAEEVHNHLLAMEAP